MKNRAHIAHATAERNPLGQDTFSFDGIEAIEERLRAHAADIVYLRVWDRQNRKNEEVVGKFDLCLQDALPYLEDWGDLPPRRPTPPIQVESDEDSEEAEEQEEDDEESEEEPSNLSRVVAPPKPAPSPPQASFQRSARHEPTQAQLAEAACRWLRDIAIRNTVTERSCRFRVRFYGIKGMKTVDSGSFLCRNHGHEDDFDDQQIREMKIPAPSFEQSASEGGAKAIRALGDYYAQWGQIVLGSVGQLQGVNNAVTAKLNTQLSQSRDQVDELVAAILEFRFREAQAEGERHSEERDGDARTLLARDALHQVGEAARAFLTARGVTPEMAEVLGTMGSSPELMATLNDPEVKGLMQNPENLKIIATMLRGAAAQARAVRAAQAGSAPNASTAR